MVTLNSADGALKSFYLDAMSEALNLKVNPFLAKIEHTSDYVTGKDIRMPMRTQFNGGISAGSETGDLPKARAPKYNQLVATLKNLYGTIEISDKAIRASANNEGAFVNLLNEEMQSLIKTASFNFGRMLFGSGNGVIGTVEEISGDEITVDNVQNFAVGMYVDVMDGPADYKNLYVKYVDYAEHIIKLDVPGNPSDNILGLEICLHGVDFNEITGLEAIFNTIEPLYGLERTEPGMKGYVDYDFGDFTEEKLQKAIDQIEVSSGHNVDYIICSWGVRRAIQDYYRQYSIPLKMVQVEGGFTAIEILGVPVVVDRFCPEGTMYLLTTKCFKLCQLCDWQWLEAEDGKILKQVPGKPVYTATLVKYAELICDNPAAQGKLVGVSEM